MLVLDNDSFKGSYRLAVATEVWPTRDSRVRKVTVSYKHYTTGEKVHVYKGANFTSVLRSCHRLILIGLTLFV